MRRYFSRYFRVRNLLFAEKLVKRVKEEKVLSFKDWLFRKYAIDYDKVKVTEQTIEIWRDAYQEYLVLNERDENNES